MSDRVMTTKQVRNLYRFAYAWRAEDDIENGDTDLSRNRELQAAEFDTWLNKIKAEVWDEAVEALDRSHGDIYPIAVKSLDRRNPHRKETPDESP